jgi:hypothetical protein
VWQSADPLLEKYLPNKVEDHYLPAGLRKPPQFNTGTQLPGMGGVFNSVNLGLYSYTSQNPLRYIDPDGNAVFENADKLTKVGKEVVDDKALAPTKDATYCNKGVSAIEEKGGNTDYKGLTANQIVEKLEDSKYATKVTAAEAASYAQQGATVIAGAKNKEGSGHVAVVSPDDMVTSGSWGGKVPVVFNVGRKNAVQGANWSFDVNNKPNYYVRNADLNTLRQRAAGAGGANGGGNNAPSDAGHGSQIAPYVAP